MSSSKPDPLSDRAAVLHKELKQVVAAKIKASGKPMRFAQFMQIALYHPQLGYYQNELHKFGERGDFITAPEMGDLFARALLAGSLPFLRKTASKRPLHLLELGAGSGALAISVLKELERLELLPQQYLILELSASLQSFQYQRLKHEAAHLLDRVKWLSCLPEKFNGLLLANEVVDAIPVERIQKSAGRWYYLGVDLLDGHFCWQLSDLEVEAEALPQILTRDELYIDGYQTEIRPLQDAWIKALAGSVERGLLLLADYGHGRKDHYHPQRVEGSLMAFSRHQAHVDALARIGLQDITAHVDFTRLAERACDAGMAVAGYTTQAGFILDSGILPRIETQLASADTEARLRLSQQIQRLMLPGQMGEQVKLLALSKGEVGEIAGFSAHQQLHRL